MRRLRIGINGFGRIGRSVFRIIHQQGLFDVVAINDINPDPVNIAYLLRYDSMRGIFPGVVSVGERGLSVNGHEVSLHHCVNILDVPWAEHGVDVLIDASGVRENGVALAESSNAVGHYIYTHAMHAASPERRRNFSASVAQRVKTVIFGVNEDQFNPQNDRLISSSICDTIALGPVIKLLEDSYGVDSGFLTTLHPWLGDQNLMDGNPNPRRARDDKQSHFSLSRSAVDNLIPKTTTAVRAANAVFPGLSEKIESFSYRVPTSIVGSAVLNITLKRLADQGELTEMFYQFERVQKWSIISNSMEPTVSSDYSGNEFSAIIDHRWTVVKNNRQVRLVYWYDNEWGYSARVVDIAKLIAQSGGDSK